MFAKFAPDGGRVAYVRENNLYVEDLATGTITPLTTDGSRTLINGTFDWVYEEELMNYYADGWRWSPDGSSIAFWQLNADSVKNFYLVNNTDSVYSRVIPIQYPKVGETNSAARVGVVSAAGGPTRWLEIDGDPRNHYIARMEWAASSGEVVLQRLNRLQNRNEVILGDARTGQVRTVMVEQDSTWVDLVDDFVWLDGGKQFTWVSDRDGWNHVYVISRDGKQTRLVTKGDFDVLQIKGIDPKGGWLYYIASPENPTQRYLFRSPAGRQGKAGATEPGTRARHSRLRRRAQLPVRHRDLLQPGQSADHPAGAPAQPPADPDAGGQPAAPVEGHCAQPRPGRVAEHRGRGRIDDARRAPQAGRLRLHPEVPAALLPVRRAGPHRGERRLGRVLPLAHHADPEGLPGGDRGQPRHSGTAGPAIPEGDLRPDGSAGDQGPGGGGANPDSTALCRPRARRDLGVELRRVHGAQRPLPARRSLPNRRGRFARDPLGACTTTSTPSGSTA